uniref:Uncharacterized protein n=1 Tax=Cyanoptyche gloeocystis TaxID=77922 RepID=A0A3G1IW62_9EUKA|nr:hypothetical protein [Cyanoptyche gloeocystis]
MDNRFCGWNPITKSQYLVVVFFIITAKIRQTPKRHLILLMPFCFFNKKKYYRHKTSFLIKEKILWLLYGWITIHKIEN